MASGSCRNENMSDDLTLFSSPELKDVVQDMQSCSRRVVWRSCSEPDAVKTRDFRWYRNSRRKSWGMTRSARKRRNFSIKFVSCSPAQNAPRLRTIWANFLSSLHWSNRGIYEWRKNVLVVQRWKNKRTCWLGITFQALNVPLTYRLKTPALKQYNQI